MDNFITALQFLTRIKLFKQDNWQEDSFSKSIVYFSVVGAIIGLCLAGLNHFLSFHFDVTIKAVLLVIVEIFITGGILCDGLMDTSDGLFSGRSRNRMLEIMRDSRVGSNGLIFFISYFALKTAIYLSLPSSVLTVIIFIMPVISRIIMGYAITYFKYARKEGVGGLFAKHAKKKYSHFSLLLGMICLLPVISINIFIAILLTLMFSFGVAVYISRTLDGLTGDTYGFIAESSSLFFLFSFYVIFIFDFVF